MLLFWIKYIITASDTHLWLLELRPRGHEELMAIVYIEASQDVWKRSRVTKILSSTGVRGQRFGHPAQ